MRTNRHECKPYETNANPESWIKSLYNIYNLIRSSNPTTLSASDNDNNP